MKPGKAISMWSRLLIDSEAPHVILAWSDLDLILIMGVLIIPLMWIMELILERLSGSGRKPQ